MRIFICDVFICFRSLYIYLRIHTVRTKVRRSTEQGRPDTAVEVLARSVQCVARGVRSNFFPAGGGSPGGGVDKTISRAFSL